MQVFDINDYREREWRTPPPAEQTIRAYRRQHKRPTPAQENYEWERRGSIVGWMLCYFAACYFLAHIAWALLH